MRVRKILLFMSFDSGFKDPFRDEFNLSVNFINDYVSKKIMALNLNTSKDFNKIHIEPISKDIDKIRKVTGEKTVKISLYFDKDYYKSLKEVDRIEYCLRLLYKGCEKLFNIDSNLLLELKKIFLTFKEEGYINIVLYRTKKLREKSLEVKLYTEFSSLSLNLRLVAVNLENKEVLLNDILIKTLPDKLCFTPLFKDIIFLDNYLIVTEFQDRPKFIFELVDVYKKEFKFKVTEFGLSYNQERI